MNRCLQKFMQCLETCWRACSAVPSSAKQQGPSGARTAHAQFLDFRQSDMALTQGELTVQGMADYMLSSQRSAVQDRAPHCTSPLTSLRALRWFAKIVEWQGLGDFMAAPVISSYGHSAARKEKRVIPGSACTGGRL